MQLHGQRCEYHSLKADFQAVRRDVQINLKQIHFGSGNECLFAVTLVHLHCCKSTPISFPMCVGLVSV